MNILSLILIVGGARCGTTALYHFLNAHPDITMSSIKEPKYFSSLVIDFPNRGVGDHINNDAMIRSRSEYYSLFKGIKTKYIGEASPDYLYHHNKVVPLIKKELGDIKIIILLRNPIYRAYSAYSHLVRDNRETLKFREALIQENYRIENNYDFMWHYVKSGFYFEQVKTYLNNFKNVKILKSEEFLMNPKKEYNKVLEFLNLGKWIRLISVKNTTCRQTKKCIYKVNLEKRFMDISIQP